MPSQLSIFLAHLSIYFLSPFYLHPHNFTVNAVPAEWFWGNGAIRIEWGSSQEGDVVLEEALQALKPSHQKTYCNSHIPSLGRMRKASHTEKGWEKCYETNPWSKMHDHLSRTQMLGLECETEKTKKRQGREGFNTVHADRQASVHSKTEAAPFHHSTVH